jgi:hypothetical protein
MFTHLSICATTVRYSVKNGIYIPIPTPTETVNFHIVDTVHLRHIELSFRQTDAHLNHFYCSFIIIVKING